MHAVRQLAECSGATSAQRNPSWGQGRSSEIVAPSVGRPFGST